MLIADQKKKENIAEYVLYMWQMEDLLRGSELKLDKVMMKVFPDETPGDELTEQYRSWFATLIKEMKDNGLESEGHLSTVKHYMKSLEDLHRALLTSFQDQKYLDLYKDTSEHISTLKGKNASIEIGDVDICLTGLYGLMLLKIKQAQISEETLEAIGKIGKLMGYLSASFNKYKSGALKFPDEMSN